MSYLSFQHSVLGLSPLPHPNRLRRSPPTLFYLSTHKSQRAVGCQRGGPKGKGRRSKSKSTTVTGDASAIPTAIGPGEVKKKHVRSLDKAL
jgi:hypothetical protein